MLAECADVATQGGLSGGWALLLKDGRPTFQYNLANVAHYEVAATQPMTAGKHVIVFDFRYDGGGIGRGGTGTITVDGQQVAQGRIEHTMPMRLSLDETFDVGADTGTPASLDYDVPNAFGGTINEVVVRLGQQKLSAADQAAVERAQVEAQRRTE